MHKNRTFILMKLLVNSIIITLCSTLIANSQCAMCTKTAAGLGDNRAEALNNGIIYLAFIPLLLLSIIFIAWRRYNQGKLRF
jgi:hypothetical protein